MTTLTGGPSDYGLKGRRALVTGASEGIGRAIALSLAAWGADVAVHGLEPETTKSVAEEIARQGRRSYAVVGDMAVAGEARRVAIEAMDAMGGVDILVSTVAVQTREDWKDIDDSTFLRTVRINMGSALELMQTLTPSMITRRWGRVVTIGSVQQARANPATSLYAATKAAQVNLVRNLARQHAKDGVTFNNIAPGVVVTARNTEVLSDPDYRDRVTAAIPAGTFASPTDMCGPVVLLCSEAGRYVTGQDIFVDGGMGL